ncbi:GAF domain-containing sensor histidine kinase [Variovorax ginsengisoli]|uniref:histidine kinase n=1 Tax=Variovorax ginsengisoli TaxID=363844 RepID=A0ABT9SF19_9BURK|nr:ATP-binding protein [Variovorax ginsengisoli]MDP9902356.1 signal transduction histidine kinase [Variovorax ginsengisoli]
MELAENIRRDIEAIGRISAVPAMLQLICDQTGMGFAAIARVDEESWTACAVLDRINFGLKPGDQLEVNSTLCVEVRGSCKPAAFDHASRHPVYCEHPTSRVLNIESYISAPIVKRDGSYFGNLCAIDPDPHQVNNTKVLALFQGFADLIAHTLELVDRQSLTESALLDAEATAELRDQFIAVLGHDLRNPLATLSAIGEIFSRKSSDPEVMRAAQRIRTTTRRMAALIEDVMDFARGRMGNGLGLTFENIPDLGVALDDVVAEIRAAHPHRTIIEDIRVLSPVHGSRGRLQQLLSNLLGNAVAHGEPDSPIEVAAWTKDGWFVLSVRNGGAPLPSSALDKIFQPYWRPAGSKGRGGLGLGLHICSLIVKSHGGSMQVTSTPEHGTAFIARLPAQLGAAVIV